MFLLYSSVISLSPEMHDTIGWTYILKYIIICLYFRYLSTYLAFTSIFHSKCFAKTQVLENKYLLSKGPLCSQPVVEVSRCKIFFCKHKTWWSYELVWKYFIFSNQSPFNSFYIFKSKNLKINVFYSGTLNMEFTIISYNAWYLNVTAFMPDWSQKI